MHISLILSARKITALCFRLLVLKLFLSSFIYWNLISFYKIPFVIFNWGDLLFSFEAFTYTVQFNYCFMAVVWCCHKPFSTQ